MIMRHFLLSSVAFAALTLTLLQTSQAEDGMDICVVGNDNGCLDETGGSVVDTAQAPVDVDDAAGYSISVDGEMLAGSQILEDDQLKSETSLATADIQVKFDGLGAKPMLNVSTVPAKTSYELGEELEFLIALNYGPWIERAHIRIMNGGVMIAQVPVDHQGRATWNVPEGVEGSLTYALRVYDSTGLYDETLPLTLLPKTFRETSVSEEETVTPPTATRPDLSEDRTALRNIPVYGGAVTVYGRDVDPKSKMYAFGEEVPVDADGNFVIQRILPPGDHTVNVALRDEQKNTLDFSRNINIPDNDWFYVGLADLTLGKRFAKSDVKASNPGEYKGIYQKGRLAFYLKGKMRGRTILTAALDTTEDSFKNILKGIDEKDPRNFLKRIDPDDYYPVYGDDSVTIEDAPTSGRFYVRVDRDDSHVMWGNFKAYVNGNKFLKNERKLYGAQGVYRSTTAAPYGDGRRTEVSVHAAEPGSLSQKDNLRGTGGSAYFLKFQDVNKGSETISIEERDAVTGFVVSMRGLSPGKDYDIDYSQGVVLLNTPLSTNASGNPQFLIVNYEYTPATTDVKGMVYGGRAHQWLGDKIRVGVTAMKDNSGKSDLSLAGADIRFQATERSYVDLHVAQSKGTGFGSSTSHDGGLTYSNAGATGAGTGKAQAYGVEARASLEELTDGAMKGDIGIEYAHRGAGFSTLDEETLDARDDLRGHAKVELSDVSRVKGAVSVSKLKGKKAEREIKLAYERDISEWTTVEVNAKHSLKPESGTTSERGQRTDFGGKITHKIDDDTSVYIFGQATAHRNGTRKRDDRGGAGGKTSLSEQVSLEAEASYGTYGPGASARVTYTPTADLETYIGYALDPYRDIEPSAAPGTDTGAVIFGAKARMSEQLSLYSEDSYDMFGLRRTLTQTYGVDYTPVPEWTINSALEMGHVYDDTINAGPPVAKNSDFDRKAVSLSSAYKWENGDFIKAKGEYRVERSDDRKRNMNSYLLQVQSSVKAYEDWRLLFNTDAVFSDSHTTGRDGKYIESSFGFAYRPTEDDRLNALFKYTFLYDLPGPEQVTVNGTLNGPQQRSHIFSADAIYDLTSIVSIGGKYGMRYGETRNRDGSGGWSESVAHLAVVRADVNIDRQWEALLEARMLWSPTAESTNYGALAAVYRHLGESFKVGVGYNFGKFSDDLADLTHDDHGVFVNAVGKF